MRRLVLSAATALALLPALASAAAADPGCGGVGKPPCTILRPVAAPAHRWVDVAAPVCVVAVGGLGSRGDDRFFEPLLDLARVASDGRPIQPYRFGLDRADRYPYDTSGAIDRSASRLRGLLRDLSDECFSVSVVAHSMGGVVADRAFSMGVSAADGVTGYVALSSPHNGAFAARALRLGVELDDTFASVASGAARALGLQDPTSAAVRDLAERRAPRPPRGIEVVRQRLVHDLTVLRGDLVDRRYDTREYLPGSLQEIDGHGGILSNALARDVALTVIRDRRVPTDPRSAAEIVTTGAVSMAIEEKWRGVVAVGGLALADVAVGSAIGAAVRDRSTAPIAHLANALVDHLADGAELLIAAAGATK